MLDCRECVYNVFDEDYRHNFCLLLDPPNILIKTKVTKTKTLNETKSEIQKSLNETTANVCIYYERSDA